MSSFRWYVNRLKSMSPEEIAWRLRSWLVEWVDTGRVVTGTNASPPPSGSVPWLSISRLQTGLWLDQVDPQVRSWRDALQTQASEILNHRLTFFDQVNVDLSDPINWQLDRNTGVVAPMKLVHFVDYRNAKVFGDCKMVWEPNRHHHLVVLARAYKATGERRYAEAVVAQMRDWIAGNPYGYGMNWRSPLELGVRLINWVWALDFIADSGVPDPEDRELIRRSAWLHCHDIVRKYSKGTSANNHLVGEAAGVFVAASFFGFDGRWIDHSRRILEREIVAQTYPDGCTREQAFGYQFFVLQFYHACGSVADRSGAPFAQEYWDAFQKMLRFQLELGRDGPVPMVGDGDDGYVLDLGSKHDRVAVMAWMNCLVGGDSRFLDLATDQCEARVWMEAPNRVEPADSDFHSISFPDGGYYLLRSQESGERVSVLFDCAELGYTSIAAHGHADALSFLLRIGGSDILIDPGTYDYFTWPQWRNYFRSTRAHNTVEIDGLDQSRMVGPFMWDHHAKSSCLGWQPTESGGMVQGSHDGYHRLPDPVTHTRTLELHGDQRRLHVVDRFKCTDRHIARWHYHFAPDCVVSLGEEGSLTVRSMSGLINFRFGGNPEIEIITGKDDTYLGWCSDGYHRRRPTTTVVATANFNSSCTFSTEIEWTTP